MALMFTVRNRTVRYTYCGANSHDRIVSLSEIIETMIVSPQVREQLCKD